MLMSFLTLLVLIEDLDNSKFECSNIKQPAKLLLKAFLFGSEFYSSYHMPHVICGINLCRNVPWDHLKSLVSVSILNYVTKDIEND